MKGEIHRTPGASPTELARKMGFDVTTILYHARILAHEGLVRVVKGENAVRFFPPGRRDRAKLQAILTVKTPALRRVVRKIQRHPGIRAVELVSRLGLAKSTVSHHLGRLRKRGVVRRVSDGGRHGLYVNPKVERWLN